MMTTLLAKQYGDYRIAPVIQYSMELDGVHYNSQGAWLGVVMTEIVSDDLVYEWVKPILSNGSPILAPDQWQNRIIKFLSVLDV